MGKSSASTPAGRRTSSKRVEGALSELLARSTRVSLQDELITGVEGLDRTTYPVLAGLAASGATTATRLARAVGLDRTVTTRYLSRLEAAGLVARSADEADGRATRVELTAAGTEAMRTIRKRFTTRIDTILAGWSKRDADRFAADLARFGQELRDR
jgi:DNA-binding MarR family transcriptional regulator